MNQSALPVRLIARLDIKGPNLVKGINLEGLRVLGRPDEFAEYYYHQGIDELFYMDVVASLYERNSLSEIIARIARKIFVPLTVGGGIRTVQDIHEALRAGADKVCINTAAIKNPDFVRAAIKKFGASTIVVAIEAIKQNDGSYFAYIDNGREYTGVEVVHWARVLNDMGVGEIMITSVDREGRGEGFEIPLIQAVVSAVHVPVIAHGGGGHKQHVAELFNLTEVSAVALAGLLHYDYVAHAQPILTTEVEGNFSFLKNKMHYSKIFPCNIFAIKQELAMRGVKIRGHFECA
jgi:cyclase